MLRSSGRLLVCMVVLLAILAVPVMAQQPCTVDSDCGPNKICVNNVCEVGCRVNSDCPSDKVCLNNECQNQPPCTPGAGLDCSGTQGLTCDPVANFVTTCCDGNPTCSDMVGCTGQALKVDDFPPGPYPVTETFTQGQLTVTIKYLSSKEITWTSNIPIKVVLMKGADGACAYTMAGCTGEETSGSIVFATPINPSGGHADISHIDFCYVGTPPGDEGSICGQKFLAPDGTPLPFWTISLFDSTGNNLLDSAQTNGDGYCFTGLAPGTYIVKETLEGGFQYDVPANGEQTVTVAGNTGSVADFFNRISQTVVPEFPTVGVSVAIIIGLGFIVVTMRQKRS